MTESPILVFMAFGSSLAIFFFIFYRKLSMSGIKKLFWGVFTACLLHEESKMSCFYFSCAFIVLFLSKLESKKENNYLLVKDKQLFARKIEDGIIEISKNRSDSF